MSATTPENAQERSGTKNSSPFLSAHERVRRTFRAFFRELLKYDYKNAGVLIFGGNPETARSNLSRVIESKHHRHADWEWIDLILEAAGHDTDEGREWAEGEFVRFICDRYGFQMPERLPSGAREREELGRLKDKLNGFLTEAPNIVASIERLERALESKR